MNKAHLTLEEMQPKISTFLADKKMAGAWKKFKPYANSDFLHNFAGAIDKNDSEKIKELYSELLIGSALLYEGNTLEKAPKGAPDLCLLTKVGKIWLEVVCPSEGEPGNPYTLEPAKIKAFENGGKSIGRTVDYGKNALRYLSVIWDKKKKIDKYIESKIVGEKEPVIIVVNGMRIEPLPGHLEGDTPEIVKISFGYGYGVLGTNTSRSKIRKNNKEINSAIFLDKEYSRISALLFFDGNLTSPQENGYHQLVSLALIHNPLAENPVSKDLIGLPAKRNMYLTKA